MDSQEFLEVLMNQVEKSKQHLLIEDRPISDKTRPEQKIYQFRREFNTIYQNQAINLLIYGHLINKFTRKGNSHLVIFFISPKNMNYLQWLSQNKAIEKSRIDLKTITNISEKPIFAQLKEIMKFILVIHYFKDGPQELILQFDG